MFTITNIEQTSANRHWFESQEDANDMMRSLKATYPDLDLRVVRMSVDEAYALMQG